jgi:magnesium-transporting ATPase (P-type)
MRLINPNDMVRALHRNSVRTWEVTLYGFIYVASLALLALSFIPASGVLYVPYSNNPLRFFDLVFIGSLLIVEGIVAYYINKKGDGKEFWRRYFSLNTSLLFVALIFNLILGFLLGMMRMVLDSSFLSNPTTGAVEVVTNAIATLFFAGWFLLLMRRASAVFYEKNSKI